MEMLPSQGMTMKPRPIRLCAACYAESPFHRIEWQFKVPALWVDGEVAEGDLGY
jgi:hypothetical protein